MNMHQLITVANDEYPAIPGAFAGCAKRWRFVGADSAPPPLDTAMSKRALEAAMHTRVRSAAPAMAERSGLIPMAHGLVTTGTDMEWIAARWPTKGPRPSTRRLWTGGRSSIGRGRRARPAAPRGGTSRARCGAS